jgi:hypothetical protein
VIDFSFDDKAEGAAAVAEKQAAAMIANITSETEANIRQLIAQAIRSGKSPYDAAEEIRNLIGLTAAQGQAAQKYKQQLIDSGLSATKAAEKAAEYADELLDLRAETIARSEIMDALNGGQDEAWQQAQDEGLLSDSATKEWIVTETETCEECLSYDGKQVPVGEEFPEGDPPLHPNCRCTLGIGHP